VEGNITLNRRLISTILIIAVVGLLAVYYFLGTDYLKYRHENEALAAQITKATRTLGETPQPAPDLPQRLASARASLADEQSTFPSDLNTTRIINAILRLAEDCKVKAIPLITRPWTKDSAGRDYYVFRLTMAVRGGFAQLSSFISRLENGELETIVIENLSVTRAAGTTGEAAEPVTASVDLAIYSQLTTPK
jgi:hypothetical protein